MISLPTKISLIYYTTFTIFAFMGLFALYINPKERKNQLFFLVTLACCVWSFSLAMMTSSYTPGHAIFWFRNSSLGWGSVYAFLLHFTLLLDHTDTPQKKHFGHLLIYIPSLIIIYAFFFSPNYRMNYEISHTIYGYGSAQNWLSDKKNPLFLFYHIYYISYMLIAILYLWNLARKTTDKDTKYQAKILLIAYTLAIVLGSILGQLLLWKPQIPFPRFSILASLFPLAAIFYIIRHYHFLLPKELPKYDLEHILNDVTKLKLYQFTALFFLMLAFVSFAAQYFIQRFLIVPQLIFSGCMLFLGCSIGIIQKIRLPKDLHDTLSALLVAVSIPFITLHFSRYNSITIGVFPLAILLISIIFDRRWVILLIGISSLATHLYMTATFSHRNIFIDSTDYLIRIIFLIVMMLLTLNIRKVFAEKLIENEKQMQFERAIASLSSKFFTNPSEDINNKINYLLSIAGNYFQSDRVYIFLYSPSKDTMTQTHEWCAPGIEPMIDVVVTVETADIPWWTNHILYHDFLYIPDIELMPEEAAIEKETLASQGIKSLICVPIVDQNGVTGFVGLDSVNVITKWTENHRNMLKIVSNLISDASEKIESERNIYTMAYYDQLTGLPNRFYLNEKLEKQIALFEGSLSIIALLFLDVDSFKYINETIGHAKGDLLLIEIGKRLSFQLSSESDVLIRFGSDEFIIMLTSPKNLEEVERIAQQIIEAFQKPIVLGEQDFFVNFSIGISIYPIDGIDPPTLIKNADVTMYESKRLGKNQYNFCSSSIKEIVSEKIRLTNLLHRALEKDELMLYYQPIISAQTGQIKGFEALLRWRQSTLGMISPALFIPIAEQTGLIQSIGRWVLMTACQQAKKWQDTYGRNLVMAVNFSINQFKDPEFMNMVQEALSCGLPPELLEAEITESEEFETESSILSMLQELKQLQIKIAIDDFGTKYSSLSRLKVLPIDKIKIDMQFVHGISTDLKNQNITKSIIALSKNLSLCVLAEGVETKNQLDFLVEHGCDEIQGYYFYKPMRAEEIDELLKNS